MFLSLLNLSLFCNTDCTITTGISSVPGVCMPHETNDHVKAICCTIYKENKCLEFNTYHSCTFTSDSLSCCEFFFHHGNIKDICSDQDGHIDEDDVMKFCESVAASSIPPSAKTTSPTTRTQSNSPNISPSNSSISSSAKTTSPTTLTQSNSPNISPSNQQDNLFSVAAIGGLVVGVVILITVTALLLAAACVVIAVKKSKSNVWIVKRLSKYESSINHLNLSLGQVTLTMNYITFTSFTCI